MIDARGLSCPMPVVMVQQEVKSNAPQQVEVLLDAQCSVENVTRFAQNHGYTVTVEEQGDEYKLILEKA